MKKKLVYVIVFLITTFSFSFHVSAASSITCSPKSVNVGDQITCKITVDAGDQVEVSSKLSLVAGNTTLTESGNIVYKATSKGTYDVTIKSQGFSSSETVTVNEKTTTTKTTTTTTTKSKSDNNYLSIITVDGEKVKNFNKTTTKYFLEVDNETKKVTVKAEAEDDKAIVDIDGPTNLKTGDNEFNISVTSEANTTKYYKVIITKKEEGKSSNTDIKSIKIRKYHLNFDKSSKTFYLKIDKETSELDIDVKLKDKNASYEIEDNENLKDGSVVKIIVTAEDETTDTYRIIIEKKESNFLPIIIIVSVIIILVIILIVVLNKKKKNNKKDGKQKKEEKPNKVYEEKALEKTIEMPSVSKDSYNNYEKFDNNDYDNYDDDYYGVDNDEEEETRILSYAEMNELEKEKSLLKDEELKSKLDEELDNINPSYLPDEEDDEDY